VRSTLRPLRSFAKHLSADYKAVHTAVTLDWSNGPVEGQINRLKMLSAPCTAAPVSTCSAADSCSRRDHQNLAKSRSSASPNLR
jgi:hypothetical protein